MSVTKQNIINHFNASDVEQIASKQLFTARVDNCTVLISYYTIVGRLIGGVWYLTKQKYSVSTTRQMNGFAKGERVQYVDDINNFTTNSIGIEVVASKVKYID